MADRGVTGVVFDLDGTLIDSAGAIRDVANALMAEYELPPLDLAETRSYIGKGVAKFVERALAARGALDAGRVETACARFETHYANAPGDANAPMPGVDDALAKLVAAGCRLAICTNKPMAPTRTVIEACGWSDLFAAIVAGDSLTERKPHPAPLLAAAEALRADPVIYVGDSEVDAQTARAAGVPFILYTEGYRHTPVDEIAFAAKIATMADLPDLILTGDWLAGPAAVSASST